MTLSCSSVMLLSSTLPSSATSLFLGLQTRTTSRRTSTGVVSPSCALRALVFDCDGVILESEHLHRQAYNEAFAHFLVRCSPSPQPLIWSSHFYDRLQNQIGGGKPKMRWYFKENGWPSSTIFDTPPERDVDRAKLIDTLQDWKTERYQEIIKSGTVKPRPGVLRLMDEAKAAERFHGLNCFLAGSPYIFDYGGRISLREKINACSIVCSYLSFDKNLDDESVE